MNTTKIQITVAVFIALFFMAEIGLLSMARTSDDGLHANASQNYKDKTKFKKPEYCKNESVSKQISDLPWTQAVDCKASCEIYSSCMAKTLSDSDTLYDGMLERCLSICKIYGMHDYTQYKDCQEIFDAIQKTYSDVSTKDLPECQDEKPDIASDEFIQNSTCFKACGIIAGRCESAISEKFDSKVFFSRCTTGCIYGHTLGINDEEINAQADSLACDKALCALHKNGCKDLDWRTP